MSFLTDLHTIRKELIDVLKKNKGAINFDIFKDFYPDKAHFLFELLQNAEDRQAQHCTFRLFPDKCEFTHDGSEQFTEANVDAITGYLLKC